jgi:hypothetical protein
MSDPFTKIKFIAYLWKVYRTALPWNLAWERNQRRLTVGGVAHPKAVERGQFPFARNPCSPMFIGSIGLVPLPKIIIDRGLSRSLQPCRRSRPQVQCLQSLAALLPSASCPLKHKVSAPAGIESAEPFRI